MISEIQIRTGRNDHKKNWVTNVFLLAKGVKRRVIGRNFVYDYSEKSAVIQVKKTFVKSRKTNGFFPPHLHIWNRVSAVRVALNIAKTFPSKFPHDRHESLLFNEFIL